MISAPQLTSRTTGFFQVFIGYLAVGWNDVAAALGSDDAKGA
ncbi:hypothetical protein XHC_3241 [Xanthomonas hortorum pv. carotae str. M081]|nr:hypothetical protein XHC_3241 [Xanthomonas hortorum pv. carotae str. M081]